KPYVLPEAKLDPLKLAFAAGPVGRDDRGIETGLYRKHCVHCHGINGDGAGPTARFLTPYPRDYRQGVFKFTSTAAGVKPTRADLKRTLVEGIAGTAMPSFMLLPDHEIEALVEYVIYLSYRGQTEELLNLAVGGDEPLPANREELVALIEPIAADWASASEQIVTPDIANLPPLAPLKSDAEREAYAASVERGKKLFLGDVAKCSSCHGPSGLGDGSGEPLYDDWNKVKPDNSSPDIVWWNLPKQQLDPRNLRLGIYRGGRRPLDLYRRVAAGIKGTPMPAGGNVLKPEEIWDLINYVQSLPYEVEARVSNEFAAAPLHP
ncbi:MAG: cytochrome c, partial [Planctomycetaceae bacterium]|nr:cytochrome c [Planctomycetaceae bacterium]